MPAKPPPRHTPLAQPAAAGASGMPKRSLGWVREVLGRSMKLERKAEPEKGSDARAAAPAVQLHDQRAELGARLLIHDPATQPVRHLFIVHDELRKGGWLRVGALPLPVIDRALFEAEILESQEPTALLASIIESLRELKAAAEPNVEADAIESDWERPKIPEVSETNFDEFELMERSWMGTVPAGFDIVKPGEA